MEKKIMWQGDGTYSNYRIPGIMVTDRGTVLAYCEARRTSSDWAMMDILLFRSTDGGKTFSEPYKMAGGCEKYPTVDNPVCMCGKDGVLHFLYCRNYSIDGGGIFCRESFDDGLTWSEPREISEYAMPKYHNVMAFGPGHGICKNDDTGTLMVPFWMVPKKYNAPLDSHHPAEVAMFYSEDNGETWSTGEIITPTDECPDPNETAAVCLPDGSVYLNVRSSGAGYRAVTWSKDGKSGFSSLVLDRELPDPTCFGSAVLYSHGGRTAVLAVNCASQTARENLTVRASFDGGKTWKMSKTIEEGNAGYSDIAVGNDGTIYVLYERDWGKSDVLASFTLDEMESENP